MRYFSTDRNHQHCLPCTRRSWWPRSSPGRLLRESTRMCPNWKIFDLTDRQKSWSRTCSREVSNVSFLHWALFKFLHFADKYLLSLTSFFAYLIVFAAYVRDYCVTFSIPWWYGPLCVISRDCALGRASSWKISWSKKCDVPEYSSNSLHFYCSVVRCWLLVQFINIWWRRNQDDELALLLKVEKQGDF